MAERLFNLLVEADWYGEIVQEDLKAGNTNANSTFVIDLREEEGADTKFGEVYDAASPEAIKIFEVLWEIHRTQEGWD